MYLSRWLTACAVLVVSVTRAAEAAPRCLRDDAASVIVSDQAGSPGSRILVRRPTHDAKADCAARRHRGDIILGATGDESYTAIALSGAFLILDSGTGPDRSLVIYAVPDGRKLLDTGYSIQGACDPTAGCRSAEFSLDAKGLTFWRQLPEVPTAATCKGYAAFMKETGAAALEEKSVFDFATAKVQSNGARRCTGRQ